MQVSDVVSLASLRYDPAPLLDAGIHVHVLPLAGPVPAPHITNTLHRIAAAASGAVAVHGGARRRAGGGGAASTAGTLALQLMRTCGLRAREAVAWLRILRPGGLLPAPVARFLCDEEACPSPPPRSPPPQSPPPPPSPAPVARFL
jgi:hypothetical protein